MPGFQTNLGWGISVQVEFIYEIVVLSAGHLPSVHLTWEWKIRGRESSEQVSFKVNSIVNANGM